MTPPGQALAVSGAVPTLQNTRPCGCGATTSVKIKYGLEASLSFFFCCCCSEDHSVESNQDSAAGVATRL